jgi:hypothetical protein
MAAPTCRATERLGLTVDARPSFWLGDVNAADLIGVKLPGGIGPAVSLNDVSDFRALQPRPDGRVDRRSDLADAALRPSAVSKAGRSCAGLDSGMFAARRVRREPRRSQAPRNLRAGTHRVDPEIDREMPLSKGNRITVRNRERRFVARTVQLDRDVKHACGASSLPPTMAGERVILTPRWRSPTACRSTQPTPMPESIRRSPGNKTALSYR